MGTARQPGHGTGERVPSGRPAWKGSGRPSKCRGDHVWGQLLRESLRFEHKEIRARGKAFESGDEL